MLLGYALGYLDAVVLGHLVAVLLGHLLGELWGGKEGETHVSKELETKLDYPGFPFLSTLFNFNYSAAAEKGKRKECLLHNYSPVQKAFCVEGRRKKSLF